MPSKTETKKSSASKKTNRRKNLNSYSVYIYRVLKCIHQEIGISKKAMSVVNSFVCDMFEKIASEASRLCKYQNRSTLSMRDISAAVKLIIPTENLLLHANAEMWRAIARFEQFEDNSRQ